jgi:hypothetical protein
MTRVYGRTLQEFRFGIPERYQVFIAKLLSRDFASYVSKWERIFESEISRQQKARPARVRR